MLQEPEELPGRDDVPEEGGREGRRCCVLTIGRAYVLSTFDAQGLADMLNSDDESTQNMAGTKVTERLSRESLPSGSRDLIGCPAGRMDWSGLIGWRGEDGLTS